MIRERLLATREQRARLVADAVGQRDAVMAVVGKVERAAVWYDRAKAVGRRVRANPLLVAAGVALFVAVRPGNALKLAATGYSLWRSWRRIDAALERFAPAQPPSRRAY